LREIAIEIARQHLAARPGVSPPSYLEAEDLAGEFLQHLRLKGNWLIRTRSGLAMEYRRWVTRFSNPAQHEIWEIVSTALRGLGKTGQAWRLDAPLEEPNRNAALWSGSPPVEGQKICNPIDFEAAAQRVRHYPPPAARGWHAAGVAAPKVISPQDALELTLALLQAAAGPVRLADLVEEFKGHIFTLVLAPSETLPEEMGRPVHPTAMLRLFDLACARAAVVWAEAAAQELTDLLCDYFIANHLLEQPVALEKFGDPRRVHERVRGLVAILRQHLALQVDETLDVESADLDINFHSRFVVEAMHELSGKCACRPGKTPASVLPKQE
jgi:hypothetical protein